MPASSSDPLFAPTTLGGLRLSNRMVMAPLTRSRASQPGDVPDASNAAYYAQRATAGLIVTEATQVSPQGKGYVATPGIHSAEQVAGWRLVTDAVHAAGGRIVLQLWHVGRISHPELQPDGDLPVAPSALAPKGVQAFVSAERGMLDIPTPRALLTEELPGLVADFRRGAELAKQAGFDGVELHAANGYLIDQFLRDGTNQRTDAYGGPVVNRMRFPLEVVDALVDVWGADRVGVRISPTGTFGDVSDSDPSGLFTAFASELSQRGLAFLEVVEELFDQDGPAPEQALLSRTLREIFSGAYIANGGLDAASARRRLSEGSADLVSFGRAFLANPDLPARLAADAPLNKPDPSTFYGGDHRGYTDYPTLAPSATA